MINFRKEYRKAQQLAKRQDDLSGTGNYLFENNTKGDFYLPRVTKEGQKIVKLGAQFFGDSYYFGLLKTGEIRLVRDLNTPEATTQKFFVFKNFNRDETRLPEPNRDGQTIIDPSGEFIGDSRFFPLLKNGRLKLIKEIEIPMQSKLLVEQPQTVTHEGVVEYVKVDEEKKKEKLLSENPLDGVKLLLD